MSFFTDYLGDAQQASSATGVLVPVILAQWADETGYGGSVAFTQGNNYAGVSYSGVSYFPTKAAGLSAYIQVLNQSNYDNVRQASGWQAQCVALGSGPHPNQYPYDSWAASGYDANGYYAGVPFPQLNHGIDLINIIKDNNLTQFGGGSSGGASASSTSSGASASSTSSGAVIVYAGQPFGPAGQAAMAAFQGTHGGATIASPVPGFNSDISTNDIVINGSSVDLAVGNALVNASLALDISQASTMTLVLHDPDRVIINSDVLTQKSQLNFFGMWFELAAIEKQGSVLTATFEAGVVAALRTATGAFSIAPNVMTRTQFAAMLVQQIEGATFVYADDSYLYGLSEGYARNNNEQLSRGTIQSPLEDSWTCLQRLASEIEWVCFESFGAVYFGPYGYLTSLPPVMYPVEFQYGIGTIDGTYDVGQPLGEITVNAVADSWWPSIGQCVQIDNLGPFSNGTKTTNWLVSKIERDSLTEPDIVITLQQPLPGLPEPASGGAQAAQTSSGQGTGQTGGVNWPVAGSMSTGRTDQGKDWDGAGDLYAVSDGTILTLANGGWPGGAFIVLQLDNPPDSIHTCVYYAEDITPQVSIGDHVIGGQVIGHATGGSSGVEIGWADPTALGQSLSARLDGPYAGSGPTPQGQSFVNWINTGTP